MEPMNYVGLNVHKRKIIYCVKNNGGSIYAEGSLTATHFDLGLRLKSVPKPWTAPHAAQLSLEGVV
jgi:hypothetical protein